MLQSDTLHGFIPWIDGLSFVGIVAGVVKGSDWLDTMLNDTGRAAITKWLKNVPSDAQDDSWPVALSGLIDNVFGSRPFSLKFILRSFVASIIAVSLVWLVYARLQLRTGSTAILHFKRALTISLIVSLIPDYFSLLVSRTIVGLIPRNPRLLRVIYLLVADAALTAIISIVSLAPALALYSVFLLTSVDVAFAPGIKFKIILEAINNLYVGYFTLSAFNLGAKAPAHVRGLTIFFYSSFFTSIWLWLYVIAGITIKATRRIRFLWVRVLGTLTSTRSLSAASEK